MANLLDTIRGNSASLTQPQGVQDESQSLQRLLRAKSGKSLAGPDVTSSNLAEQQAVAQTNQQLQQQVQPQAQIQQAGLEQQARGQAQQEAAQVGQIAQQRKFDTLQNRIQTDEILSDLERSGGQLNLERDRARMEQVGFQLRLQDTAYLDNLQREGNRQRLGNELQFKQELAASVLGDNQELLEKSIGNKSLLDASDRDFRKAMGQMDVDTAYEVFSNEMQSSKDRALWQSIGALGGAGIGAAGAYSESQSKKKYYNEGGGKNTESYEASQYRE